MSKIKKGVAELHRRFSVLAERTVLRLNYTPLSGGKPLPLLRREILHINYRHLHYKV
ncbi:MAG: hypothetical protein IJU14_06905 [Clostridia bacterium]|nr:hypothetical protein [Clostridia bacterium]